MLFSFLCDASRERNYNYNFEIRTIIMQRCLQTEHVMLMVPVHGKPEVF